MNSARTQAKSADTRKKILDIARAVILGKGYAAVGLNEILTRAGVPKGSFYHYFKSKDAFGRELLEDYFAEYRDKLERFLGDNSVPANRRLLNYFEYWQESQCNDCQEEKCLVVKLSAEVTDLSEQMRQALQKGMEQSQQRIARCVSEALDNGELASAQPADELARELYSLWLGATLISKVNRSADALHLAMGITRQRLGLEAVH